MCNYSKGVYNDGMERGRNTGIAGAADILKRMGMDAGKIVEQLMLQYGLGSRVCAAGRAAVNHFVLSKCSQGGA